MNKKGIMDDMVDFLFTVMAFFFIWFFVTIALVGGIEENKKIILENVDEVSSNLFLLNYLRTPIEKEFTIADLIAAAETDVETKKKLSSTTNKLILDLKNPLFKRIMIKYPSKDIYDAIQAESGSYSPYSETTLSGSKGSIKVIIHGQQKESTAQALKLASTGGRVS